MIATTLVSMALSAAIAAPLSTSGQLGVKIEERNGELVVGSVVPGSPASTVLRKGDVLVALADIPLGTGAALKAVLSRTKPGERVSVTFDGGRGKITEEITLGGEVQTSPMAEYVKPAAVPAPVVVEQANQQTNAVATVKAEVDTGSRGARSRLILAAQGPGEGNHAVSVGGAYKNERPFVDLRYLYGINSVVTLDFSTQTQGVVNDSNIGARFHVVSGDQFSMAVRLRAHEQHVLGELDFVMASVSPGIMASFGDENWQATIGLDYHAHVFGWIERMIPGGVFGLIGHGWNPYIGVEYAITDTMNIVAEGSIRTFSGSGSEEVTTTPSASIGFSW